MMVIRAEIVDTVVGFLVLVSRRFDQILEGILTEVVLPTTAQLNEESFAALRKLAGHLNPPEFVGTSSKP